MTNQVGSFQIQRPKRLTFIAFIYVFLPFVNFIQTKLQFQASWLGAIAHFPLAGAILLLTAPIVAIGLFQVKRWGYLLFLVHAVILVIYNIYFTWKYPEVSYAGSLFRSVVGLVLFFYFLRREIYSPYLALYPRGFRRKNRIDVTVRVKFENEQFLTRDLSLLGMFLKKSDSSKLKPQLGARHTFLLTLDNEEISISGTVMRLDSDGIGVAFQPDRSERRVLKNFLNQYFPERVTTTEPIEIESGGEVYSGSLWNLSMEGAYIALSPKLNLAEMLLLKMPSPISASASARVRWINEAGNYGKPPGFGIEFTSVKSKWRLFTYLWLQEKKVGVSR